MDIKILTGDVFACLKTIQDESIDCIVTSPPYWGLRDYGVAGQIGMERTLGEHLEVMVSVFREIRRVLKKEGTCWINYGDCYATAPNGRSAADTKAAGKDDRSFRDKPFSTVGQIDRSKRKDSRWGGGNNPSGGFLKPKDLCMISNRLAIALQDDGWWIRSEIIWHKNNPMPESTRDRPAVAHEKIWMVTKSPRYFYNADAVRTEAVGGGRLARPAGWATGKDHSARGWAQEKNQGRAMGNKQRGHSRRHAGFNERWDKMTREEQQATGANLKNVWTIATKGFPDAHFATFPPELPEICIKAGCPEGGIVLDPFGGAGTTAVAANRLSRHCILIELNPKYVVIAKKRILADIPMFTNFTEAKCSGPLGFNSTRPKKGKQHDRPAKPRSGKKSGSRKKVDGRTANRSHSRGNRRGRA